MLRENGFIAIVKEIQDIDTSYILDRFFREIVEAVNFSIVAAFQREGECSFKRNPAVEGRITAPHESVWIGLIQIMEDLGWIGVITFELSITGRNVWQPSGG